MRAFIHLAAAAAVLAGLLTAASSALADSRTFIIANESDGYGIDQCLAKGERCGVPMANYYCRQRDFSAAAEFRKVDPDEITGAVPAASSRKCSGFGCAEYVAITCQR
jgi:hypothetical protein